MQFQNWYYKKISFFTIFKIFIAILLVIIVWGFNFILNDKFNPDWIGYLNIFEDGAWLQDEKRDPAFLLLINVSKFFFGNSYIAFRTIILFVFLILTFFIATGKVINFDTQTNLLTVVLVLLSFLLIRFTIQIREGLAVFFLLLSISYLVNDEKKKITKIDIFKFLLLLFIASLIHGGTTIYLIVGLFALMIFLILKYFDIKWDRIASIISWSIPFFVVSITIFFAKFLDPNEVLSTERFDLNQVTELSIGKLVYWGIYGILLVWIVKKANKYLIKFYPDSYNSIYISIIVKPLMFSIYSIIVVTILMHIPGSIVAVFIRLLNLNIGLIICIFAFRTREYKFLWLISFFLLIDQIRTVLEALVSLKMR